MDDKLLTLTPQHLTTLLLVIGTALTTGTENTAVGSNAADALTVGNYNVAMGLGALGSDTQGSRSTAIGYAALFSQNFTSVTPSYNTAVGFEAG